MPSRIRSKGGNREGRICRRGGKGITYRRGGVIRNIPCPSCIEDFDDVNRRPLILVPCGHTICSQCAKQLQTCPLCRSRIDKLLTNYLFTSNDGDFVDAKFVDYTRPCAQPPLPRMCDPKPREPAHRELQSTLVAISPQQERRERREAEHIFPFEGEVNWANIHGYHGPGHEDTDSDDEDLFTNSLGYPEKIVRNLK